MSARTTNSENSIERASWRDVLPIHPAAERIPEATEEEKRALAADLARHGLRVPIVLVPIPGQPGRRLLDGRTRLDLLEAAGKQVVDARGRLLVEHKIMRVADDAEAERLSLSLNVHRRHLTAEDKRKLIADLLKADPTKSDRQIAGMIKASPTFVGKVRAEKEATGDVSTVDTRRDTKGRKQPAKKAKTRRKPAVTAKNASCTITEPDGRKRAATDEERLELHDALRRTAAAGLATPCNVAAALENPIITAWRAASQFNRENFVRLYLPDLRAIIERIERALEGKPSATADAPQAEAGRSATSRAPRPPPRSVVKAIADRAEARSRAGR